MKSPIFAALAALSLVAACAPTPPPPRPVPQAAPTPPPAMPTGDGRVATLNFPPMSTELNQMARINLTPVVERLLANPGSRVVITTYSGPSTAPMARERAAVLRQILIDRGVSADRIRVVNGRMARGADVDGVQLQVQDGPTRRNTAI